MSPVYYCPQKRLRLPAGSTFIALSNSLLSCFVFLIVMFSQVLLAFSSQYAVWVQVIAQVIAWKNTSPEWSVYVSSGRKTVLTRLPSGSTKINGLSFFTVDKSSCRYLVPIRHYLWFLVELLYNMLYDKVHDKSKQIESL